MKALRLHQWLKNLLIFLPLALSHQFNNPQVVGTVVMGFLAYGFCASSVYLLNDLLDLENDRRHSSKKNRPFASGNLSLMIGLLSAPLLLIIAFFIAGFTTQEFIMVLSIYFAITLVYSFRLKSVVLIDVITLAALYTLRIIAGAALIHVFPTFWLLAFSMFLFLSLAMVKRVTELIKLNTPESANNDKLSGRSYSITDQHVMAMMGVASGYIAVLVFALYINDQQTRMLYATPEVLWLICPLLLYLIGRIWIITMRGKLDDDPVLFAARDRRSQIVTVVCAGLVWLATVDLI